MSGGLLAAAVALAAAASSAHCSPERCSGRTPKCPAPRHLVSKASGLDAAAVTENVFFRNAAPYPAEILRVDGLGREISHGVLPPLLRRSVPTMHGDVWIARAVRPTSVHHRKLLLEHRIGAVPIDDCACPQPDFVDCSKPPTLRDPLAIHDPVVFENRATEPVDIYFYNGTCEELVSWDEVGGVHPSRKKPLLSTQGHSFRLRSAATGRMLMAHTLSDLVIKGCDDEEGEVAEMREGTKAALGGLESLRAEARFFEREAGSLRQRLSNELAELALARGGLLASGAASNATAIAGASSRTSRVVTVQAVGSLGGLLSPDAH